MTEAKDQETIRKSAGAPASGSDGWTMPASYGDESGEYTAVRDAGAGLIDLSSRGQLVVSGSEAVQFLNGLITNDMKTLEAGQWMPAVFPNVSGRLVASVRVIRLEDGLIGGKPDPIFLIDTETATHDVVLKTVKRFTLAGDFRVTDLSGELALLSLQGKDAARMIRELFGAVADIAKHQATQISWAGNKATVVRATHTAENGFDVFVEAQQRQRLWQMMLEAGGRPVGFNVFEVLRIEAGQPRFGIDMDETNVVSETSLDDAVSYTKGCYIGQEIIARIKYRGHVAKKLSGIIFESSHDVHRGASLLSHEDKEIGRLTSVTFSPRLNRTVALGYLKYDYLAPGTNIKALTDENQVAGTVTELPFIRGSWYEK
ncbi:MAG TPA: glycine cleavage T C-terminal barrel domain-containing protein [Pyrinomonadaceae bacterium]|nr:glycine cleavage T C-terminal barrel domain-containing protein [Pyrinomonadaceae bacterium]